MTVIRESIIKIGLTQVHWRDTQSRVLPINNQNQKY